MSHIILQTFNVIFRNKILNNGYLYTMVTCLIYTQVISLVQYDTKKNFTSLQDPIIWKLVYFLNDSVASFTIMLCVFLYWCDPQKYNINYIIIIVCLQTTVAVPSLYNLISFTVNYNSILNNGLLNIHPIYLYIGASILLLLYLLYEKNNSNNETYKITLFLVLFKRINLSFFFSSTVALALGCVWAQQELNWGGWWNWDSIEFVALLLTLFSLTFIHINSIASYNGLVLFLKCTPQLLLLFYMLSRHNIISSIHSFVSANTQPIYGELQSIFVICLGFYIFRKLGSFLFSEEIQIYTLRYIVSYITIISLIFIVSCAVNNMIWQRGVYSDIQNIRYYYCIIYSALFTWSLQVILTKQRYKLVFGIISIIISFGIMLYEIILIASIFNLSIILSKRNTRCNHLHKTVNIHIIVSSVVFIIYLYSHLDFIWFYKNNKTYSREYVQYYNTVNFLFFDNFICRINDIPKQIILKTYYLLEFFHETRFNNLTEKLIQFIFLKPTFNANIIIFKKTLVTNQFTLGFILLLMAWATLYTYLLQFHGYTQVV